jgi:hypothetical protein
MLDHVREEEQARTASGVVFSCLVRICLKTLLLEDGKVAKLLVLRFDQQLGRQEHSGVQAFLLFGQIDELSGDKERPTSLDRVVIQANCVALDLLQHSLSFTGLNPGDQMPLFSLSVKRPNKGPRRLSIKAALELFCVHQLWAWHFI